MEDKRLDFEDVIFSGRGAGILSSSDRYDNATDIASDLKSALLAELDLTCAVGSWERDLSLLSSCSWVKDCAGVVDRLIQLREISPLDIVAVSDMTERVSLRPFIFSLALAFRKLLNRVVLVDCDLRRPSLHTVVGGDGREGFIDMVKYGCSFSTASSETEVEGIFVIGAGSHPVSSEGELVGRELERVFHSLRTKADIALVCVPPFLVRKQVNPFLNCMDGVLLCLNDSAARKSRMRKDFSALWKSDIPVIGIVSQKSSQIEERQTLVLRAHTEDQVRSEPKPAAGQVGKESESVRSVHVSSLTPGEESAEITARDEGVCRPAEAADGRNIVNESNVVPESGAVQKDQDSQGGRNSEWQPISSMEVEPGDEIAPSGDIDSGETTPEDEADLVEKSLFGKQKHWRQYVMGICVVLGIVGVLALKETKFSIPDRAEMDTKMMRSILLPGSDGITTGDETQRPRTRASASTVNSSIGEKTHEMYVQISSRANHDDAVRDSARVSGIGIRVLVLPGPGERGRLYRVVAGPFPSMDEANSAVSRIKPLGVSTETRIITEGVRE